ncbi:MAG: hypothetical protein J6A26_03480 [Oscillospiraceae bacterium]|nr:hypothetical protein [Oscillospiraceae bacterium]
MKITSTVAYPYCLFLYKKGGPAKAGPLNCELAAETTELAENLPDGAASIVVGAVKEEHCLTS